jgi:microsomal dipeptidase-like Zn-dependent dipeptidase
VQQVRDIVMRVKGYKASPASFIYDREKAKEEKNALERKKREEGKRKAYEARMMRKAKREGKTDLMVSLLHAWELVWDLLQALGVPYLTV